jgi:hypothetical protein
MQTSQGNDDFFGAITALLICAVFGVPVCLIINSVVHGIDDNEDNSEADEVDQPSHLSSQLSRKLSRKLIKPLHRRSIIFSQADSLADALATDEMPEAVVTAVDGALSNKADVSQHIFPQGILVDKLSPLPAPVSE